MDISNYNNQAMPNMNTPLEKSTPNKKEEAGGCFDTDWCTSAANAIGEAFNSEDFFTMYEEDNKE